MNGRRSVGMDGRKTRMDWRRTGIRDGAENGNGLLGEDREWMGEEGE